MVGGKSTKPKIKMMCSLGTSAWTQRPPRYHNRRPDRIQDRAHGLVKSRDPVRKERPWSPGRNVWSTCRRNRFLAQRRGPLMQTWFDAVGSPIRKRLVMEPVFGVSGHRPTPSTARPMVLTGPHMAPFGSQSGGGLPPKGKHLSDYHVCYVPKEARLMDPFAKLTPLIWWQTTPCNTKEV